MTVCAPSDLVRPFSYAAPAYDYTEGHLVAALMAECYDDKGPFVLDPEQRLVIDDWFGYVRTPDGPKLAAFEGAVVAPRQNMKTGVLKAAAIGKAFISRMRLVVWSSHETFAASEAYRDIKVLIESNPDLLAEVVAFHGALGRESIELTDDRRLLFKSRTGTSAQSLSGDCVILDEAFALQADHMASLAPTLAARPDPQMLYGSSAGHLRSTVLRALRDRGHAKAPRLAWAEWAATLRPCADPDCDHTLGSVGCWLDDPEAWRECNTAIARGRMTVETIAGLRAAMAAEPMRFARECLGQWDDPGDDAAVHPIDAALWDELADPRSKIADGRLFALHVAPRRKWSCIVAAGLSEDGRIHVEVPSRRGEVAYWRGTDKIVPTFRRLSKRFEGATVRILAKSQAAPYASKLIELGFAVELVAPADYPAMCAGLVDFIADRKLAHLGDDVLTSSVSSGVAAEVGDGDQWRWSVRRSAGDVTPLVAMTIAADGAEDAADYDVLDSVS